VTLVPPGALIVARQDLADTARNRRQLVIRALIPIALVGSLVAIVALTDSDDILAADTYRVALTTGSGNDVLLEALAQSPTLDVVIVDDIVADRAGTDISVALPAGTDDRFATGQPVKIEILELSSSKQSRAASAEFQTALSQHAAAPIGQPSTLVDLDFTDVTIDKFSLRLAVGRLVATLVILQSAVLVGGASARFASRRIAGQLVTQLLYPLDRRSLILGKGLAELGAGLLAAIPILLLATLLVVATGFATGSGAGFALTAVLVIALTAATVGFPVCAMGLLIGITSRSPEQASLATTGVIVSLAVLANIVVLSSTTMPTWATAVPVAGSARVLNDVLTSGSQLHLVVVATVSTLALGLFVTRLAASRFDSERLALRAT
jgi:hypothetical protein